MILKQPLVMEPGVTRFFGLGDIAGKSLLEGWASPEQNHNWNDGIETSLGVLLPVVPETACVLDVEARPHLAEGLPMQEATLYLNGFRLGYWRLDRLDGFRLTAVIEPEFWLKRQGGGYAKCTWHLPNSTRPSALTQTQDNRLLGICFQSIVVNRVPTTPTKVKR